MARLVPTGAVDWVMHMTRLVAIAEEALLVGGCCPAATTALVESAVLAVTIVPAASTVPVGSSLALVRTAGSLSLVV